ncbi:hypothetical protein FJ366_02420, partial [Candidatus Dependentiae bacterium]|nr:hypothetical protein [Candidatus Dependentiae bacterium]
MMRLCFLICLLFAHLSVYSQEIKRVLYSPYGIIHYIQTTTTRSADSQLTTVNTEINFQPYENNQTTASSSSHSNESSHSQFSSFSDRRQQRRERLANLTRQSTEQILDYARQATNEYYQTHRSAGSFLGFATRPMCFVGTVLDSGMVEYHPILAGQNPDEWFDLGAFYSPRTDPFLQHIVRNAHEQTMDDVSRMVRSWSDEQHIEFEKHKDVHNDYAEYLNNKYSGWAKNYGGYHFHPSALYTMSKYRISPWSVIDALDYGKKSGADESYNPFLKIYSSNQSAGFRVLLRSNMVRKSEILAVANENDPLEEPSDSAKNQEFSNRKWEERCLLKKAREKACALKRTQDGLLELSFLEGLYKTFSAEQKASLASFDAQPLGMDMYEYNICHHDQEMQVHYHLFRPSATRFVVENKLLPNELIKSFLHADRSTWINHPGLTIAINDATDLCMLIDEGNKRIHTIFKGAAWGRRLNTPPLPECSHEKAVMRDTRDCTDIFKKYNSLSDDEAADLSDTLWLDHLHPSPERWEHETTCSSDGMSFYGWHFTKVALFGALVCDVSPRVVATALGQASTSAGAAVATGSTFALAPNLTCLAIAGAGAFVVYNVAQKIVSRIVRVIEKIKNLVNSLGFISDNISSGVLPSTVMKSPEDIRYASFVREINDVRNDICAFNDDIHASKTTENELPSGNNDPGGPKKPDDEDEEKKK